MRINIMLVIAFATNQCFAQTKKDTIISKMKKLSTQSTVIIKSEKVDSIKVFEFSYDWKNDIDFLLDKMTNDEIISLKKNKNASLNLVGYIIDFRKNNSKGYILNSIQELINAKKNKYLFHGGYDTTAITSLERCLLNLIEEKNSFFKPDFNITQDEINAIEGKILISEHGFKN